MKKFILSLLILIVALAFSVIPAEAYILNSYEEKVLGNFALTPVKVETSIKPGGSKVEYMTVVNRTGKTYDYSVKVEDYEGTRNPNDPIRLLGNIQSAWTAKDWLTPEIDNFTLRQGERIEFAVRIEAPKNALVGGHYAGIFVYIRTAGKTKNGARISTESGAGTLFLIKIPGKTVEKGRLRKFSTTYKTYTSGPIDFSAIFQNDGNIHLKPAGQIVIKNQLGQVVNILPVKPWTVLPESLRQTLTAWDEKPLVRIGRYTAELSLAYGRQSKKFVSAKTSFLVVPLNLMLGAGFIFIGLTLGLYYFPFLRKGLWKLVRPSK